MSEELKIPELNLQPLDEQTKEIAQKILDEENIDKVKDLTALFNLNAQKRNVMRVIKMNGLLDSVTDQIVERFEKKPDNFSNEELLKYMQVTENAIDRANKNLNLVEETPPIQYQQNNQVNINIVDSLDRDSRERVMAYLNNVLSNNASEIVEIKEEEVDTNE